MKPSYQQNSVSGDLSTPSHLLIYRREKVAYEALDFIKIVAVNDCFQFRNRKSRV